MIKVLVNGASGKMGLHTVAAIQAAENLELVATCQSQDNLAALLTEHQPTVAVDFTQPNCVFKNTLTMIEHNVHPVIGTSGLTLDHIQLITDACLKKRLGGLFAPNFSIGAVLMMKYAQDAARYFSYAEIIESHHEKKVDAPSGTATHTQHLLNETLENTPIHSVRMPGVFAEQTIIFGAQGETLSIKHAAIDRECMMPGVLLACQKVTAIDKFIVGLEHFL